MIITADTNLLVRIATDDDHAQMLIALDAMQAATAVAIPTIVLCELAWVLRKNYRQKPKDIAAAIRAILSRERVLFDRPGVQAGLEMLDAGGDFADGVIAHEGRRLGGETFVSFDRGAVELVEASGQRARALQ